MGVRSKLLGWVGAREAGPFKASRRDEAESAKLLGSRFVAHMRRRAKPPMKISIRCSFEAPAENEGGLAVSAGGQCLHAAKLPNQ